jgi:RHS repeat-associated protein
LYGESASGRVEWQWDNSDPFGNNAASENPGGAGQFSFPLRFPGQYFDKETNTHYNINRDYDPAIGRYIESDPIGLDGGINTYAYVDGNPLSYVDPDGLLFMTTIDGLQRGTTLDDALTHGAPGNAAVIAGGAGAGTTTVVVAAGAACIPPAVRAVAANAKKLTICAITGMACAGGAGKGLEAALKPAQSIIRTIQQTKSIRPAAKPRRNTGTDPN